MNKVFTVIIERDPESGWLVGEVVELPGCHTQAPDLSALEQNIREAIEVYLQTSSPDEPLPDYVGTWRVEIVQAADYPSLNCGVARSVSGHSSPQSPCNHY
jgi:predicted RNase H-like HicB family nuclease